LYCSDKRMKYLVTFLLGITNYNKHQWTQLWVRSIHLLTSSTVPLRPIVILN
jgi:hypothetical protein